MYNKDKKNMASSLLPKDIESQQSGYDWSETESIKDTDGLLTRDCDQSGFML